MNHPILVVEDNAVNLELVTDLLTSRGFQVLQAQTAEEGIRYARSCAPGLILMDLSLPGMDGLAATRLLKADPATAHLRIIALTAHAMRGDDALARAAGCDGYVPKPIDTRHFPDQVASFLARPIAGHSALG
jgi:CheY-like chemotaxis protein